MTRTLALKNGLLIAGAFLLVISVAAHAAPDKKDKAQGRLLYGKVLDQQDNPVAGAIVYLTNSRTHEVKTYIVSQEGTYRFPGLSTVDYEVYAQYNGHKKRYQIGQPVRRPSPGLHRSQDQHPVKLLRQKKRAFAMQLFATARVQIRRVVREENLEIMICFAIRIFTLRRRQRL